MYRKVLKKLLSLWIYVGIYVYSFYFLFFKNKKGVVGCMKSLFITYSIIKNKYKLYK